MTDHLLVDILQLDGEVDRLLQRAMHVDVGYLSSTVLPALLGEAVGADEFERRDFLMNQAKHVQEMKDTLLIYDAPVYALICDYDFDKAHFPVEFTFSVFADVNFSFRKDGNYLGREFDGFIGMKNVDEAKRVRAFNPSIRNASVMFRPVGASLQGHRGDTHSRWLECELVGLRPIEASTGHPLCEVLKLI